MPKLVGCSIMILLLLQVFNVWSFRKQDCVKDVHDERKVCYARIPVFKWDDTIKNCVPAIYMGCHPSNNKFHSIDSCQRIAGRICKH
ncbi:kappaPI-actitoxin-Avd3a-like [Anoplophora glabripennis]|uniref:kappaPI-actitoxin-Avd3a-like n=1 Tax=Anoplophora glabripennis TaxID=217634 RepID=UPI00087592AF|nr:kappaPI-actitoxin-Avd3a-like [Anoplophora glabripennis]